MSNPQATDKGEALLREAVRIATDAADRATHQLDRDHSWTPRRHNYEGLRNALRNTASQIDAALSRPMSSLPGDAPAPTSEGLREALRMAIRVRLGTTITLTFPDIDATEAAFQALTQAASPPPAPTMPVPADLLALREALTPFARAVKYSDDLNNGDPNAHSRPHDFVLTSEFREAARALASQAQTNGGEG